MPRKAAFELVRWIPLILVALCAASCISIPKRIYPMSLTGNMLKAQAPLEMQLDEGQLTLTVTAWGRDNGSQFGTRITFRNQGTGSYIIQADSITVSRRNGRGISRAALYIADRSIADSAIVIGPNTTSITATWGPTFEGEGFVILCLGGVLNIYTGIKVEPPPIYIFESVT
jgi:hypothetical protein